MVRAGGNGSGSNGAGLHAATVADSKGDWHEEASFASSVVRGASGGSVGRDSYQLRGQLG